MRCRVRLHAVRLVEQVFPTRADVPGDAPRADCDVAPAVGDAELGDVHVAGDDAFAVEQGVREAVVAVADDEVFVFGCESFELVERLIEASSVGARDGDRPARRRRSRTRRRTCSSAVVAVKSNGHASTGAAAWNAASPRANAGTIRAGSESHGCFVASVPFSASVRSQSTSASDPESITSGTGKMRTGPPQSFGFVERGREVARCGDLEKVDASSTARRFQSPRRLVGPLRRHRPLPIARTRAERCRAARATRATIRRMRRSTVVCGRI